MHGRCVRPKLEDQPSENNKPPRGGNRTLFSPLTHTERATYGRSPAQWGMVYLSTRGIGGLRGIAGSRGARWEEFSFLQLP